MVLVLACAIILVMTPVMFVASRFSICSERKFTPKVQQLHKNLPNTTRTWRRRKYSMMEATTKMIWCIQRMKIHLPTGNTGSKLMQIVSMQQLFTALISTHSNSITEFHDSLDEHIMSIFSITVVLLLPAWLNFFFCFADLVLELWGTKKKILCVHKIYFSISDN